MIKRRTFSLSGRYDSLLSELAKQMDISLTEVIQRALEKLQESEARRRKEVGE
jgi:hypothetical protein